MDIGRRLGILLAGTVLGTSFLVSAPAFADDAQLQRQIDAMQRQLQVMQAQLAETKKQAKAAAQQAQQTQAAQQQQAQGQPLNVPANLYAADVPVPTKGPPSWFDSIHVSLAGSYIALEGAWRQRNESSSGASDPPFGTIPLENSPLYRENEFRFSAQQSRIAFKASGDIDPARHVAGYYEMDFLGGAPTGNSRESNSYNPRIRQVWFAYNDDYWHSHFSAGQMWSLLTQNKSGILNGTENIPLTIDAQYVVGFNWARQPAIRYVQDVGKIGWFGVSVESSETAFASNGNGVAGPVGTSPNAGTVVPPTVVANVTNNCNAAGLLDPLTNCSINPAPDIIEKFALDPGWGHYEALGLQRWFTDATAPAVRGVAVPGSGWTQRTTFGWGVGGNALLPVWPTFVDLQGSVLYGQGIGRYASSQLADVVVGPTGNLQPLTSIQFMVGAVVHPSWWWQGTDIYAYYGQEQTQANAWTVSPPTTQGGWGNTAFNSSCGLISSGPNSELVNNNGGTGTNFNTNSTVCTANVQRVREITVGFWQDIYKGDLGRARVGLQYEYVMQDLFPGSTVISANNPIPNSGLHPNNNIVFLSLRYYPFN